MAEIKPFAAVRPTAERASQVAALPYDVMNSAEARDMVRGNPYSFLHVDKAEIDLDPAISLYDDRVYAKARENLEKLYSDGVLVQDEQPNYYIYQLNMDGRKQTGLVAGASVDDYTNDVIKKHEFTRADKEEDRIRHVDTCNAQTGPIFLAYRENAAVTEIIEDWKNSHPPVYDFIAEDGISHTAWVVDDRAVQQKLTDLFAGIPNLYIADGHHRTASAARVALQRRAQHPDNKEAAYNHFLSVSFPSNQLYILDYNRVVKDLNGISPEEFLQKIGKSGIRVEKIGKTAYKPSNAKTFGMYLRGEWYALDATMALAGDESVVDQLDVSLLQRKILTPLLGIGDPRTDTRIDFIGGIRGLSELEQRVDSGQWVVAFAMFPTAMAEVMDIADHRMVMPPKSTWFEPKLRSGLFINRLD